MPNSHHAVSLFTRFAKWGSRAAGRPAAFTLAVLTLLVWAISGPLFGFSDTWQLIINTGTTVVTFLMVFLIQNTQNRDSEALHVKLDELIRANKGAHNALLDLEELDRQVEGLAEGVESIQEHAIAAFERLGYPRIDEVDVPFDPRVHEVVSVIDTDDLPPRTVAAVARLGFGTPERLLRPAGVVVTAAEE